MKITGFSFVGRKGKNITIGIGYMPVTVKPSLVYMKDGVLRKTATFNNEKTARQFMDIMAEAIGIKPIDWTSDDVDERLRIK